GSERFVLWPGELAHCESVSTMRQEGWPVHLERIKRFVHPEGYGFWLDPDGLFTLLGAIIAIAALSVAVDIPNAIRLLGDPVAGRPVVATVVSAAVYLAMARAFASLVRAWTPGDFEATGRFHAWVAAFGIVLALGIVVLDRKSTRLNSSHVSISYAV